MTSNIILLPYNAGQQGRWQMICETLKVLADKCRHLRTVGQEAAEQKYGPARYWLRDAIFKYNIKTKDDCNYRVVQDDDDMTCRLVKMLPVIVDNALSLPQRLNGSIDILKIGDNKTLTLSRNLICSLLANGFMCTFPRGDDENTKDLTYFNFWRLFHHHNDKKAAVKREKIKCLLEYFDKMGSTGSNLPNTNITFERRCLKTPKNWKTSTEKLHILCVVCGGRIEDAKGMLQVDFANKYIGGGVLADGAVQEEIRFLICPELLVSRLFTQKLDDNEAMIITGSIQFSDYVGYREDFKFKKLQVELDEQRNILPKREAQVVAIDAKFFLPNRSKEQFTKSLIDRELHKSYVGFRPGRQNFKTPIATGNWGCGTFNGNPQLKFIIQWMAASQNQRSVQYFARNECQKRELEDMARHLVSRKVTIGQLYEVLIRYDGEVLGNILPGSKEVPKTIFQFLRDTLK